MRYRIRKVTQGDRVWFTAECRRFFIWGNCYYGRTKFPDYEGAKIAVEKHKQLTAKPKKELVIKL